MGSENSKSSKNDGNAAYAEDALKFGPSTGTSNKNRQNVTMQQPTQINPQRPSQSVPPPAYSQIDLMQVNHKTVPQATIRNNPNTVSNAQMHQNYQQTQVIYPTGSQMYTESLISENKQINAKETGNAAKINTRDFVYINPDIKPHQEHPKHQNVNKSKVAAPEIPPRVGNGPPAKSPPYDQPKNPYVWTNNSDSKNKLIDFDQELAKAKKDVLGDNDVAAAMNRELNKNKSLAEVRKLLVNNEYLSDVKFILNSIVFYGHKLFLVTASPLFYQHFQINGNKEMRVDGIEEGIFVAMLSFCYTGTLHKLTDDNILTTLLAADKLKISQVYTTCCSFISTKINPGGVFVVFEKAIELKNDQFQKKCLDYIKKNEAKCFSSHGFFKIGLASLVAILQKCDYTTEKTNEVIEKWNHGAIALDTKNVNPQAENSKKKGNNQQQQKNHQKQKNQVQQQQQNRQNQQQQQFNQNQQQQQKNQQQQSSKNPKQNEGQKPRNRQRPNKKIGAENAGFQLIPNLFDLDIPPPPFAEGYQTNPFAASGSRMRHADSMSNLSDDLMSFKADDDDDDLNGLVCVDDDEGGKVRVDIKGMENAGITEFARIDFIAKRSFLLHEVWFNTNIIENSNEIRITISVFEGEKRADIHSRSIKGVAINRCNFIKFSRQPLKIFIGQKFFIKLNFSEQAKRKHLYPQSVSSTDFLDLRRDDEVRKYFNCINKLVVSEMT